MFLMRWRIIKKPMKTLLIIGVAIVSVNLLFFLTLSPNVTIEEAKRNGGHYLEDVADKYIPVEKTVCSEHRHVALVKVHKAGSSTILNILQRFGETRNLTFALPKTGNYFHFLDSLVREHVIPAAPGKKYDILVHHAVYNYTTFKEIMAPGTVFIATLREPFATFLSSMNYFVDAKRFPVRKNISEYIFHRDDYYQLTFGGSVLNNRMAFDMGLNPELFVDEKAILEYIKKLDIEFLFIMILEYLDECLVLLKRYLCWGTKDILYQIKNRRRVYMENNPDISKANRDEFARWAKAEVMLYDHYHAELWRRLRAQKDDFFQEVKWFKGVLQEVQSFCFQINNGYKIKPVLYYEETQFSDVFNVTAYDCKLMFLQELSFLNITMNRQEGHSSIANKPINP